MIEVPIGRFLSRLTRPYAEFLISVTNSSIRITRLPQRGTPTVAPGKHKIRVQHQVKLTIAQEPVIRARIAALKINEGVEVSRVDNQIAPPHPIGTAIFGKVRKHEYFPGIADEEIL